MDELLTIEDVAKLLHMSKGALRDKAKKHHFPQNVCSKFGKYYFFNKANLMNFIFKEA